MNSITPYRDRPLAFLARYVLRRKFSHGAILLSVLLAVGSAIGSQYGVKNLVDTLGQDPTHRTQPWLACAILIALVSCDNLFWRVAGWISTYTFVAVGGDLRTDLFDHLTDHSPRFFTDRQPGALSSRISATALSVFTIENTLTWAVIPSAMAVVSSMAVLATVYWPMAAILAVIGAAMAVGLMAVAANGRYLHQAFANRAAEVNGELVDIITNMPIVRAFGALRDERARFSGGVEREMRAQRRSLRYLEGLRLGHAFLVLLMTAAILVWSLVLWTAGRVSTGDIVLATTLGFTILHGSRDMAVALVDVVQHFAKLREALDALLLPHDLKDAPDAQPIVGLGGSIEFRNVTFCYPSGQRVFRHFHLRIPPGQKVGLVGASGGGKSTLLSLVQRLYDVDRGQILIDNQNISGITQDSLRGAISVVPQDISLFHRSILENIRYGRPSATDDEVRAAAEAARADEFIALMPEGYDTTVGDRGMKLSGGQRQRIAIARAFLKNAPILLLDEATSALDTQSEGAIQEAMQRLMTGRTVLAVAHRLSTVKQFDRIIVMAGGRIVEDGAPEELMGRSGIYASLLSQQSTGQTSHVA